MFPGLMISMMFVIIIVRFVTGIQTVLLQVINIALMLALFPWIIWSINKERKEEESLTMDTLPKEIIRTNERIQESIRPKWREDREFEKVDMVEYEKGTAGKTGAELSPSLDNLLDLFLIWDKYAKTERGDFRYGHVKDYFQDFLATKGKKPPVLFVEPPLEAKGQVEINLFYPLFAEVFAHIFREKGRETEYNVIQRTMDRETETKYDQMKAFVIRHVVRGPHPETLHEYDSLIDKAIGARTRVDPPDIHLNPLDRLSRYFWPFRIELSKRQYVDIRNRLKRDLLDNGTFDVFTFDKLIEKIECSNAKNIHIVHKIFGRCRTNITFMSDGELDQYLKWAAEYWFSAYGVPPPHRE